VYKTVEIIVLGSNDMRVSENEFVKLVQQSLADIPKSFVPYMDGIVVDVLPLPDRETLRLVGVSRSDVLLGLFHGTPLTEQGVERDGLIGNRIVIYQRNIERVCQTRQEIIKQVRKTVLHEIGHHFGLDEDELDELGYG